MMAYKFEIKWLLCFIIGGGSGGSTGVIFWVYSKFFYFFKKIKGWNKNHHIEIAQNKLAEGKETQANNRNQRHTSSDI